MSRRAAWQYPCIASHSPAVTSSKCLKSTVRRPHGPTMPAPSPSASSSTVKSGPVISTDGSSSSTDRTIVDPHTVEFRAEAIRRVVITRRTCQLMAGDGLEDHRWRIGALAHDGVEIETEDHVGVVDELEAHRRRDVGVGDARLHERERSGEVEVVGEPLAKELVPAVEGDGPERDADALRETRRRCLVARKLGQDADALAEVVEALSSLAQRGDAEVHARAVMREETLVTEGQRIETELLDLVDLERVARGLRHLHAIGEQMLPVHPRTHDGVSQRS